MWSDVPLITWMYCTLAVSDWDQSD